VIVVLEGPDCAGKSTLAARLVADGGTVICNGPPPKNVRLLHLYAGQITAAAADHEHLTVFDRLHVGVLVYGPLFRNASALSAEDMASLEAQLDAAAAIKVHVDCRDETLLSRFLERGDDTLISADMFSSVAHQYGNYSPVLVLYAVGKGSPRIQGLAASMHCPEGRGAFFRHLLHRASRTVRFSGDEYLLHFRVELAVEPGTEYSGLNFAIDIEIVTTDVAIQHIRLLRVGGLLLVASSNARRTVSRHSTPASLNRRA
jgi:hypothetical protein